ncbi:protein AAR2 homolog [Gigantopelta aegis]|uniref:protein AAR2 homolog n=1 Tax=Gigantopelta aegis TaxID=1735272 RepID=UPI001B8896E4|nr:protein AAR2 homolog [Gigantopelta aegis]
MDQERANVLFREGAMLIFLDVPEGTEFGIDYNSWNVGPSFRGIKMIPAGVHFIYYSACNSTGQVAPRTGFFYNFQPHEIVVRKWNKYNEDIEEESVSPEELERYDSNKKEMDRFLGPYPYESYKKWISMTNHISPSLLEKLLPDCRKISSVTQFVSLPSTTQSRKSQAEQERMDTDADDSSAPKKPKLPDMQEKPGTRIHYTCIEKHNYPSGASAAEITKYSMDSSYALELILTTRYPDSHTDILGEIQFAFVCFLVGQNYDSFEQWKKLVHLLCTCEEACKKHIHLFSQLIGVLHFQIREIPEDFFVDIVSKSNFLTSTLQQFFSTLENGNVDVALRRRGLKFRDHLTEKFKWDFISDPEEDAPVVVETDTATAISAS